MLDNNDLRKFIAALLTGQKEIIDTLWKDQDLKQLFMGEEIQVYSELEQKKIILTDENLLKSFSRILSLDNDKGIEVLEGSHRISNLLQQANPLTEEIKTKLHDLRKKFFQLSILNKKPSSRSSYTTNPNQFQKSGKRQYPFDFNNEVKKKKLDESADMIENFSFYENKEYRKNELEIKSTFSPDILREKLPDFLKNHPEIEEISLYSDNKEISCETLKTVVEEFSFPCINLSSLNLDISHGKILSKAPKSLTRVIINNAFFDHSFLKELILNKHLIDLDLSENDNLSLDIFKTLTESNLKILQLYSTNFNDEAAELLSANTSIGELFFALGAGVTVSGAMKLLKMSSLKIIHFGSDFDYDQETINQFKSIAPHIKMSLGDDDDWVEESTVSFNP